jgi:hypothetical protein
MLLVLLKRRRVEGAKEVYLEVEPLEKRQQGRH